MQEQHSPEYRTVAVFGSLADAELARGLFEADGIAAAVLDGADAWLLPGAGREIRVLVPLRDLARARELLASPGQVAMDEADEELVQPEPEAGRPPSLGWLAFWLVAALLAAALAI